MAKPTNLFSSLTLSLLCAVGMGVPAVSLADTMLEFRNHGIAAGEAAPSSVSVYVTEDFVRINEQADNWTLYDRVADTVYVVDETRREYTPLDRQSIAALSVKMQAARDEMQQQLQKMTPEQRAMIEQMVGHPIELQPEEVSYQSTGDRKTVNGYDCSVGRLVAGGETREEFCTAQPRAIGMSGEEYQAVRSMYSLMAALQKASGFGGGMPSYDQLDGIPIEIRSRDGSTQVISRASHGDVDTRLFRVPEGFSRVSPSGTAEAAQGASKTLR